MSTRTPTPAGKSKTTKTDTKTAAKQEPSKPAPPEATKKPAAKAAPAKASEPAAPKAAPAKAAATAPAKAGPGAAAAPAAASEAPVSVAAPSAPSAAPPAEVAGADAAYARLEPKLAALAEERLVRPNVDAQHAAMTALAVAARLEEPARRAVVEALGKLGLVKIELLHGLRDVALATWHARRNLLEASAAESRAALSPELRAQAIDCRKRMRAVLEANVRDPASLEALRLLRSGRGDLDLATDLLGYARLYRERRVDLERDKQSYRANDEALAKRLAADLGKRLTAAEAPASRTWARAQSAAFALLVEHYTEAARVGRFVERDEPGAAYASIYAR